MNVVDSSGWLEYFAGGPNASFFAPPIENAEELIVPTLSLFEVMKHVLLERGEREALQAVAHMQSGRVVGLDTATALLAAKISAERKLPLADSVMIATAHGFAATFWTQDGHFEGLPGVRYRRRRP